MTSDDLAQFRALLRAQAAPAPRAGLASRLRGLVAGRSEQTGALGLRPMVVSLDDGPVVALTVSPALIDEARFGRRAEEAADIRLAQQAAEGAPMLLTAAIEPAPSSARVLLRLRADETMQTPCSPDDPRDSSWIDLASRQPAPSPGSIAGWSVQKPPSAQSRLLSRLIVVCDIERQGLEARLQTLAVAA